MSTSLTTTVDTSRLNTQVAERLELFTRLTRAIRHDLGNVLYPSQKLLAEATDSGGTAAELADRVDDLMHMVNACRSALTNVRPVDAGHSGGAIVPVEWWREVRHFMKAASNPRTKIEGPSERGMALPVSAQGLTMLTLSILMAIELQMREPAPDSVTISAKSDPIGLVILARGHAETPPQLPAITRQIAERLECKLDAQWSVGQWRVAAGLMLPTSA